MNHAVQGGAPRQVDRGQGCRAVDDQAGREVKGGRC
jgi:hypothetical protein